MESRKEIRDQLESRIENAKEIREDMKKYKSLRSKLVLIIGAALVVMLFLFFLASMKLAKMKLAQAVDDSNEARANYVVSEVDANIVRDSTLLEIEVAAVASIDFSHNYDSLTLVLENVTNSYSDIQMAYVEMDDGSLYNGVGWVPEEGWDGRTREWYKKAIELKGDIFYSDPYVDDNTGDICVTISRAFKTMSYSGVAALDLNINSVFGSLSDTVKKKCFEDDYVFIESANGLVIWNAISEYNPTVSNALKTVDILGGAYVKAAESGEEFNDCANTACYASACTSETTGWTAYYVSPAQHLKGQLKTMQDQLFIIFVIFTVIICVFIYLVGTAITSQMRKASDEINKFIGDVKAGHGDLTYKVQVNDKNETGMMVDGVNTMIATLGEVIGQINNATESLVSDVDTLKSAAVTSSDNISSISATMQQMSAGTEETNASTSMVTQQISDIAKLTSEMNSGTDAKTKELGKNIEAVAKNIEEIKARDAKMLDTLNSAIADLNEKISATKKVEEIKAMTDGISNVASQTNLLSLNASIEAARAGDAGRGFAVVASEIGSLANDSAQMAKNIETVSNEVLAIVEQLVKSAESVADVMIEISKQNSEEKNNILNEYDTSLHTCLTEMESVASSSNDIATAIAGIKDAIDAIDVAVTENSNGIGQIADSASELVAVVDEVSKRAESVGFVVSELQTEVKKFKF